MNPAPGLLSDWITIPGFLWLVLGCIAVACLGILTVQLVRVWDENDAANQDAQNEAVRDVCDLESCDQPARVVFNAGIGLLYICEGDAAKVSQWALVVGTLAPKDGAA